MHRKKQYAYSCNFYSSSEIGKVFLLRNLSNMCNVGNVGNERATGTLKYFVCKMKFESSFPARYRYQGIERNTLSRYYVSNKHQD